MRFEFLFAPFMSADVSLRTVCCMLLACIVLVFPFVWLGEKGVHPLRAFARALGSRGLVGGCVLAVLFVAGTIFGGHKVRGPAAVSVPTPGLRAANAVSAPSLRVINSWDPRLPAYWHAVTNDALTAIVPTPTSVLLRAEWPSPYFLSARYLEFLAKPDLATSDWIRVGMARAALHWTELAVEIPRAALPFDASRAAFFSFGPGADSDGDGMPDGWELAHGLDPSDPSDGGDADLDGDGIANRIEFLMDADPRSSGTGPGFAAPGTADPARAGAWEVSPSEFLFTLPCDTGTILERTFPVERLSAAERFFISTDASCIVPYWTPLGFGLTYGVNGEAPTNCLEVVLDAGMPVPLPEGPVSNITVRLQAPPGGWVWMTAPLHLVRWSPRYVFEKDDDVCILADDGPAPVVAVRRSAETADFRVRARVDTSSLPPGLAIPREDLFAPPAPGLRVEVVDAEAGTVVLHADDPLWADLPPEGTNGSVSLCCWEVSSSDPDVLDAGPRASTCADPWPLSSSARRRAFRRACGLLSSVTPRSFVVRPAHPRVSLAGAAARAGRTLRAAVPGAACACTNEVCTSCSLILLDDVLPLGRACFCYPHPPDEPPDPEDPVTESADECPCGNGTDDAPDSQQKFASLHLRVPLGDSESDGLYGYVWTSLEEPAEITPAVFNVLGAAGTLSTTNALGEFTVTSMRPGGKTVAVARIAGGVSLSVTNASGRFEYRWEVRNDPGQSDAVHVRRLTVSGNATVDARYVLRETMGYGGPLPDGSRVAGLEPSERSLREDALRDVQTVRRTWASVGDPDLVTDAFDETYLGWTQRVSAVMSEYAKLGAGSFACRRLARRFGYDASGPLDEARTYWTDGRSRLRHGRLRSLRSNREPWRLHDYDALGRETVRLEQLDGSPFPESLAADGVAVSHFAALPEGCSARAVVTSYAPGPGDAAHRNDRDLPRRREEYVLRAGAAPLLVRTETWTYTRAVDAAGVPVRTCTHTSVHGADASLPPAVDSRTEYPEGDYAVPAHLRGRAVSETDADGVTTTTAWERGTWNAATRAFAAAADGDFLPATTRRSRGDAADKTYAVEVSELSRRLVVHSETCLAADDAVLEWTSSAYDDVGRLRSRLYSDGTSETNAYSCCRLLWSRDRRGRKVLRSARTGSDDLYHAEEEVWLADVSTNGAFRVTQHFADGLGRETATVAYAGSTPGEAEVSVEPDAAQTLSRTSTEYGVDERGGVVVHTDERGAVTVRRVEHPGGCTETTETVFTNGVEVLTTRSRSDFGGGSSTRREWDGDKWAEERRFDDYLADGRRVAYVVTESSDCGTVTNSVTTYDHLGRVVSVSRPGANGAWIETRNFHDGASSRLVRTETDGESDVTYGYDELGERISTEQNGIVNRVATSYETADGEVWRVRTSTRIVPGAVDAVSVERVQLTGLSDALRSRGVSVSVSGKVTRTESSFDSASNVISTVVSVDGMETEASRSSCALLLSACAIDGSECREYDAFGRVATVSSFATGADAPRARQSFVYDVSGNIVETVSDYGAEGTAASSSVFDMLEREVSATDLSARTVETGYDGLGRTVSVGGDTHPLMSGYDSAGRKTQGLTTRDGGETWDATTWIFDPRSGLNTAKRYADGSQISYAYTDNGRRTRTTWARGVWKENAYDAANRISGVTYSDGTPGVAYSYTGAGKVAEAAVANGAQTVYGYDGRLLCTSESVSVGADRVDVVRTYDDRSRCDFLAVEVTNVAHAVRTRRFDAYGRVVGYGLTNACGRGMAASLQYTGSRVDGIAYTLPNGGTFTSSFTRSVSRPDRVTRRDYRFGAGSIYWHETGYDLAGRPTNAVDSVSLVRAYLYNRRNELAEALVGTNAFGYAYDSIGNRQWSSVNAVTNDYAANCLNQYAQVGRRDLSPPSTSFAYDADGNLTNDGRFAYAYDAENRMLSARPIAPSEGDLAVVNAYDHRHRRIMKRVERFDGEEWQTSETHTFTYDGCNIVLERIAFADGSTWTVEYFWGDDLSGTEQGAGGVGGLVAVSVDGAFFTPCYDHNGNIVCYVSETGAIDGQYVYDPYGNVIEQHGTMPNQFNFGFSTKYFDRETGMLSYQRRFYCPDHGRWLNRDPIEEADGENLYCFVYNNSVLFADAFGLRTYVLGWNGEPQIQFDDEFPYDPKEGATIGDYLNWAKWRTILGGARFIGHLEDATIMYQHYLEGSGTPMTVDYHKAYREDSGIAISVRNAVREAQKAAENLAASGGAEFQMSSDAGGVDMYPTTENWQKALGGHSLWGEASVYNCNERFSMAITIHVLDKYNFNKGAADIATGAPDNENGRFEVLGWAKSFEIRGTLPIAVEWTKGSVGEMYVGSSGRWSIGRSRVRSR